jgi:hypothetical protein
MRSVFWLFILNLLDTQIGCRGVDGGFNKNVPGWVPGGLGLRFGEGPVYSNGVMRFFFSPRFTPSFRYWPTVAASAE